MRLRRNIAARVAGQLWGYVRYRTYGWHFKLTHYRRAQQLDSAPPRNVGSGPIAWEWSGVAPEEEPAIDSRARRGGRRVVGSRVRTHEMSRRMRLLGAVVAAVLLVVLSAAATSSQAATTVPAARQVPLCNVCGTNVVITSFEQGFDGCQSNGSQPTTQEMHNFFYGTPLDQYYLYLGGSGSLCGVSKGTSGITSSWVRAVLLEGWGLVGIWYGHQCCGGSGISTTPSVAEQQGTQDAQAAVAEARSIALNGGPIVADIEGVGGWSGNPTDVTAVVDYGSAFDQTIAQSGYVPGIYGSSCSSALSSFAHGYYVPSFMWAAWGNRGQPTVWGYLCLSDGLWTNNQRHGQYRGTHQMGPFNGQYLNADSDCAGGPIWGNNAFFFGGTKSYDCAGGNL